VPVKARKNEKEALAEIGFTAEWGDARVHNPKEHEVIFYRSNDISPLIKKRR